MSDYLHWSARHRPRWEFGRLPPPEAAGAEDLPPGQRALLTNRRDPAPRVRVRIEGRQPGPYVEARSSRGTPGNPRSAVVSRAALAFSFGRIPPDVVVVDEALPPGVRALDQPARTPYR